MVSDFRKSDLSRKSFSQEKGELLLWRKILELGSLKPRIASIVAPRAKSLFTRNMRQGEGEGLCALLRTSTLDKASCCVKV